MDIRRIGTDDAEAFLHMLIQLDSETKNMTYEPGERPQDVDSIRKRIEASSESNSLLLCAASDGNEIIGFLSAERGDFNRNRHSAYIVIGILNKGRSRGLGSRLFDRLLEWAGEQGITRLELTVMCRNEGAIALYKKYGFEIEGTKRNSLIVDGKYVDEYYMSRLLPAAIN
jgi:RimJ/RimL family protein N-acetyltransferase